MLTWMITVLTYRLDLVKKSAQRDDDLAKSLYASILPKKDRAARPHRSKAGE
jgi:hypothetical protein